MNGGLHGDMVRTLNNALAQAVEATTTVEKERDDAVLGRQLMAMSLATISDKATSLQALLEQERTAAASKLESQSADHTAALATERERESAVRSALEDELDASRRQADKLDNELWQNAEKHVNAGSRLGGLQQEAAQPVTVPVRPVTVRISRGELQQEAADQATPAWPLRDCLLGAARLGAACAGSRLVVAGSAGGGARQSGRGRLAY